MNSDPASLDNLRDIAELPPVPWWPPAPGWWIVFALLGGLAVVLLVRAWRRWRVNAYRRAALRELRSATCVSEIAEILKRAALCAYPRTDVAALSGSAWCEWLGKAVGQDMPAPIAAALTHGVFSKGDAVDIAQVSAFANDWIHHHHREPAGTRGQESRL